MRAMMSEESKPVPGLPALGHDAHKRTRGRVLVIAGSRGMGGAARLAARGALAAGAGLVELAVPESIRDECVAEAAVMVRGQRETMQGSFAFAALPALRRALSGGGAVVLGPGLGRHEDTLALARRLVMDAPLSMVVDADALSALAGSDSPSVHPRIFTPHAGEAARILGSTAEAVQAARERSVLELQQRLGGVVVLKGHGTLICDGRRVVVNPSGHAGLARGGTGDVLAGVLGALLAAGMDLMSAAELGVFLHGLAAEKARPAHEARSLTLDELLVAIPSAMAALPPPSPR
jgi:NAD(P)H-hydrate epimerase